MLVSLDRVGQVSATTGTGTYTLGAVIAGFQAFAAVGSGNECHYVARMGQHWEVGLGTVTVGASTTLSRDVILASSNAGSVVSWGAGQKTIYLTDPAARKRSVTVTQFGAGRGEADSTPMFQAAMDALQPTGGVVDVPAGEYTLASQLVMPPLTWLRGDGYGSTVILITDDIPAEAPVIVNQTFSSPNGEIGCSGLRISGITFDGELRVFPDWLSDSDGNPIADPEADYRVGGVLAPTTFATGTATISDGEITGITLTDNGSGYLTPPAIWITGDGTNARARAVLGDINSPQEGTVVAVNILTGERGFGYTTANVEFAGGGADPSTALVAANRRNGSWREQSPLMRFQKCDRPIIEDCRFVAYAGTIVFDAGCDALEVRNNVFEDGGQTDFVGNCLWSGQFGTAGNPGGAATYRRSTNTVFQNNTIRRWKRSAALFAGEGQMFVDNRVDGWGEACVFVTRWAEDWTVARNIARHGTLTDIVCHFVECNSPKGRILDNIIEDVDGPFVKVAQSHCTVRGNVFIAGAALSELVPFGPFSERAAVFSGFQPIANENRNVRGAVQIQDIDGDPGNAPKSTLIADNKLIDPDSRYPFFVTFSRGSLNSIANVVLENNDVTEHAGELIDKLQALNALNLASPVRVRPASPRVVTLEPSGGNDAPIWNAVGADLTILGGGLVRLMPGTYRIESQLVAQANVTFEGLSYGLVTVEIADIAGTAPVIINQSFSSPNGELGCPNICFRRIIFDGSARVFYDWLSDDDGNPIADPEADYRAGGLLAPTTIATATATINGDGGLDVVTLVSPGSGYVYPPSVWVFGDGRDAKVTAILGDINSPQEGQVVGFNLLDGWRGYGFTTVTLEIAGGGADPTQVLTQNNRRNELWLQQKPLIRLNKCDQPLIEECGFVGYRGANIVDNGCDGFTVDRCFFEGGDGDPDTESRAFRSGQFGDPWNPGADFRQSTNSVFSNNLVRNWKSGVVLFNGRDQKAIDNNIDGWNEGCFRIAPQASDWLVARNKARTGRIADIVGQFMEAHGPRGKVVENTIADTDGNMIRCLASHVIIKDNTFIAGQTINERVPFGPFSERVNWALGRYALANELRNVRAMINLIDVIDPEDETTGNTSGVLISGNTFIDPNGLYPYAVTMGRGVLANIRGVSITDNNLENFNGELIDWLQVDRAYDPDAALRMTGNVGHASSGASAILRTIASGSSGRQDFYFGFRPRVVYVMARAAISQTVAATTAIFVDEEARLPGTVGSGNIAGMNLEIRVDNSNQLTTLTERGGPRVSDVAGAVFGATGLGFSSRGWSFQVTTSTADVEMAVVGIP